MRRSFAAIVCAAAVMLTGCFGSGKMTVENAKGMADEGERVRASANAELMMQNAKNYCADCGAKGIEVKSGRYSGKLDTARQMTYDGSKDDFDAAMDTYTNGMTKGYYVVMVTDGNPTAAYWCESDISSMDFSKDPEGDLVIGKCTE